ncbi:MAG: hypothetical protein II705_06695 [Clostridia bacterium]|nr:hypothetical protein [Clostridia bacterium]
MILKVSGQGITVTKEDRLVSGSENLYRCFFDFSPEWDGFEKTAVFISGAEAREMPVADGGCVIPWEVLERDGIGRTELKIGVYGIKGDVRMPTVYTKPMTVETGAQSSEAGEEPSPTRWEEMLRLISEGKVKGDKGDRGDAATVSMGTVTTGEAGSAASVTNSGDAFDAVFDFTVPRGDRGEKGDKGDRGEKGDAGEILNLDASLSLSGRAAEAKAVGDELKKAVQSSLLYIQASNTGGYASADDFPANRIINISSNITAAHIANLPAYGEASYVLTLSYNPASAYSAQIFFGRDTTAVRLKLLSGWTPWRIGANYADVAKYAAVDAGAYAALSAVPENVICSLNFTTAGWSDAPEGAQYGVLAGARISPGYKLQIVYEYGDSKRIWWRIVARTSPYGALVGWQGAAALSDLQTVQSFCNKLILSVSSYVDEKDITALSEITENVIMLASQANFSDSPYYSPIFFNKRYSTNYDIQFALKSSSGQLVYRIIDRRSGTTYQDWTVPSLLEPYSVLSVGDSICYGSRNGHRGYLGDLNLVRQNASYPGACLANIRMNTANHLCIYQQLIDFSEADVNAGYTPDVIVADGGVNDYFYNAPLGAVPSHPAVTAEEAAALDKSTLLGGLEYLFYLMITKYPSAQRFFVAAHRIKTWPWTAHFTGGYTQTEMNEAIAEVCRLYGVELIDVFNRSVINSAFSQYVSPVDYDTDHTVTDRYYVNSDGIHPLALGYREGYVPLVREALRAGTRK